MASYSTTQQELESVKRRRKLAEMLMAQSMQPIEQQQAPGIVVPVSPLQGLAKMLQAGVGAKKDKDLDIEEKALGEKLQAGRQTALASALRASQGNEVSQEAGGVGPSLPPDPSRGMAALAQSGDPSLMQMGAPVFNMQQQQLRQQQEQAFKAKESELTREAKMQRGAEFAPTSLGKLIQERNALPPDSPLRGAYDQAIKNASSAQERNPSFMPLPTSEGIVNFDRRTGTATPITGQSGAPARQPAADPGLQADITRVKTVAKTQAEAQAGAAVALPQTVATAEQALTLIDQMIGKEGDPKSKPHPGFQSYVGGTLTPGARFIPGSQTASYEAMHEQLTGKAFLEAFQTLKGGGQITEIEGRKATQAITRMNKSQSEAEYMKAAREFQEVIRAGVERAKRKAGGTQSNEGWSITPVR